MKNISDLLKHPLFTLGLFILILILGVLVFSARAYDMTLKIGDKELSITKPNLEIAFRSMAINTREICIIEMYKRPTEQELYMTDIVNQMHRIIMSHHVKLLAKHGITENFFSHPQYKAYMHIISNALAEMKDRSKKRFTAMYELFDSEKKAEFENFARNTTAEFIGAVGVIVQDEWINLGITKEQNYEWTRQLVPELSSMILDVFKHAFEVQLKYSDLIKKIDNKSVEIISNYD